MSRLCFPLGVFIVSGLAFRSLTHFEFLFVYGVRECSNSFFYMLLSSFPSTTYWRDCLFSIVYSCLLCWRSIDHDMGIYFWALYSFPLAYVLVFMLVSCCFSYYSFIVYFPAKDCWGYSWSFVVLYKLQDFFLFLWKMSLEFW